MTEVQRRAQKFRLLVFVLYAIVAVSYGLLAIRLRPQGLLFHLTIAFGATVYSGSVIIRSVRRLWPKQK